MNKWITLAEEHEEEIKAALEEAFADSIRNQNLEYNVELYDDGTVSTWYDAAGSNSFTSSSFNGKSICVGSFCNQYFEIDQDSLEYENTLSAEQKQDYEENKEEEGWSCVWAYLYEKGLKDQIDEAEDTFKDWYISEYAGQEAEDKFDTFMENLENADCE